MHKLKGIALAVEHAQRQRDGLAELHLQAQRNLAAGEAQLDQLRSYAKDIDMRWVGASSGAYGAEVMRHYHQFGGRLQHAMGMQGGVITGLHKAVSEAHAALLQAEFRLAAIQKLYATRLRQQQQIQARREQVQTDELATQAFLRRRPTPFAGVQHGT